MTTTFDARVWAAKFRATCEESLANDLMDSGWSKSVADGCVLTLLGLYRELFHELARCVLEPADFFDRPHYAAVVAAIHEAVRLEGGAP